MPEKRRKATRLTVSLDASDYQVLSQIALASDASMSWVIRKAIRQFVEQSHGEPKSRKGDAGVRFADKD